MIFKDKDIEAGTRELYKQMAGAPEWDLLPTYQRDSYRIAMISILKAMGAPMNLSKLHK